jgi:Xaa-Pro aminopeptidase
MGFSALDTLPVSVTEFFGVSGIEVADIGAAMNGLRAIRSEEELAILRESSRIADIGGRAFLDVVRAGVSEREAWSEAWYAMQRAGAEDVHMTLCCGPRSFWPHPPSDAVFKSGDVVSVELSPRVSGYFSQANRMCFIGEPSREWQELSDLAIEALDVARNAVRPGLEVRQVVERVSKFISRNPLGTMDVGGVHRLGHGCGLAIDEGPFLTSASTEILQPNMTMALHPIVYLPYRHSLLMLGDYVRVTDNVAEALTTAQREIPVL